MKNLENLPPDFGKFYVKNFGEEVGYDNFSIIINNFIQINGYMYISFCECYWDNKQYILILQYDTLKVAELLKFRGHKELKETLIENYFFKNRNFDDSDYIDNPLEEFFDTPIEVMVESIPSDQILYIGDKPFLKFNVTKFSFPKVIDLKKSRKK